MIDAAIDATIDAAIDTAIVECEHSRQFISPGLPVSPDRFATMRLVLRHRGLFAAALTLVPLAAGTYVWLRSGVIDFAIAGLILAPLAWLVARVLLELLDVVAETLLPR